MAPRCSFCGSPPGRSARSRGLFTVLMCADCQAARGYGSGPIRHDPRGDARRAGPAADVGLEQKAAANRQVIAITRQRLTAGEDVPRMYQEPGVAGLERQGEVAEALGRVSRIALGLVGSGAQPDEDVGDGHRGLVADGELVVAGRHRAELLAPVHQPLHLVALAVALAVEGRWPATAGAPPGSVGLLIGGLGDGVGM
jgi:hypothetical protein